MMDLEKRVTSQGGPGLPRVERNALFWREGKIFPPPKRTNGTECSLKNSGWKMTCFLLGILPSFRCYYVGFQGG